MGRERAIERDARLLAERQHGVVSRQQLLALGFGSEMIDHRQATGRLVPQRRGVYAYGHQALRREGLLMVEVLRTGPDCFISHRSAGPLWHIRPWSGTFIELTVRGTGGRKRRRGVVVHRSPDLQPWEVHVVDGVPVTSVARTLVDLAGVVPPHHLRRAVERAEQRELFDLRAVERVMDTHPRRPGIAALRALLADAHAHDLPFTRSDVEAAMLQLCLEASLPRPKVNRYDGGREVDFRWPQEKIIVEVDGWSTHRTRRAFAEDRRRDRLALREGWRVARYPATEILYDKPVVAAELAGILSLGASSS